MNIEIPSLDPSIYQDRGSSLDKEAIIEDFAIAYRSRLCSNAVRKEVLRGRAKFGVGGGGKELPQIALSRAFQIGDYYSGYYRDLTFMMHKGLATIKDIFAHLYGDTQHDPFSGGRQMANHFATPLVDNEGNWINQSDQYNVISSLSSLGGNITHALGIALASKIYKNKPFVPGDDYFSREGNELSICTLGDATTSEGIFFEALNAAGVMKIPLVYVIFDDGYGISVPTAYQTTKGSISEIIEGFRMNEEGEGVHIFTAKAWDYLDLVETFKEGFETIRRTHAPAVFHIEECTQPNGHSTSGSHERYKSPERLAWEKEQDGILHLEQWILENGYLDEEELASRKAAWQKEVAGEMREAWTNYFSPIEKRFKEVLGLYNQLETQNPGDGLLKGVTEEMRHAYIPSNAEMLKNIEQVRMLAKNTELKGMESLEIFYQDLKDTVEQRYNTHLFEDEYGRASQMDHVPAEYDEDSPILNGFEVLNKNFEALFDAYPNLYAFGEDVGKIGDVNQGLAGLQEKFGEERIFDTGIREWTIAAQGIGMSMRGLRPIAEIQYIDYIYYALTPLADDLSSLRYRSNGQQVAPAIIRTRGHRLEGIWHSGSPLGMLLHSLRGMHVLVPRNMTQAAGMYNALLKGNDPALLIECLNGYRQKEKLPANLGEFTVPLGVPEILKEGEDISLVTYGSCVRIAQTAISMLEKKGISVELIDVQSLLPFDTQHIIRDSLAKTNRILFLDEDVPGGASAFMLQQVIEGQQAFELLDSPPKTITAKASRTPYGDDGDYYAKPQPMEVFSTLYEMMKEVDPHRFI